MSAAITKINTNVVIKNTQPELALVEELDSYGKITKVCLYDNETVSSTIGQAKSLSRVNLGDTVLVQNTRQGIVVIAQLALKEDYPAAQITDNQGHIKVINAKSVTLSTQRGTIEVHQDGKIVLDATELTANSERDLTLAGWPIRLN